MEQLKPISVSADIYWAFLSEPNQMSGKYQVDLCNLSKEAVETLTGLGINVKRNENKPEQGYFITAKSAKYPIFAVDKDGKAIPDSVKVANGSKAVALVKPYQYNFKGKQGVSAGVSKLIIKTLVEYESKGVTLDDLEDDDIL